MCIPTQLSDYTPVDVAWLILHLCQHIRLFSLIIRHAEEGVHAPPPSCQAHDNVKSQACCLVPLHVRGGKVALHGQETHLRGGKYECLLF